MTGRDVSSVTPVSGPRFSPLMNADGRSSCLDLFDRSSNARFTRDSGLATILNDVEITRLLTACGWRWPSVGGELSSMSNISQQIRPYLTPVRHTAVDVTSM
jgi:hypothetical protein